MDQTDSRRRILQLTGITIASSLSGCTSILGQNKTTSSTETTTPSTITQTNSPSQQTTTQETAAATETKTPQTTTTAEQSLQKPTGALRDALVPDSHSEYTYPVMGHADAPITATLYGSWKCPYTQEFVHGYLQTIVKKFVQSGDLMLKFREVAYDDGKPYHGRDELSAAHAGLAIWNHAPEKFWRYFAILFANQGNSMSSWATPERLLEFANFADVSKSGTIRNEIQAEKYKSVIKKTTAKTKKLNIDGIPRVVVRGTVTAPTVNPKHTVRQITRALANR